MSEIVRILIVDDSAYVRKVIRQMLSRSPFLEIVGAARDGREALELAEELKPDVITCDLIMPELDGVGFIKAQMARRPVPIVVVSVASESGELVLAALDAGAVDFVQKPTALATDRVLEIADELIEKVKGAARGAAGGRAATLPPAALLRPAAARSVDIVVIGISTGGPQALKMLIPRLPAELPVPIAIVLHMPVGYTELYARKLNEQSALHVLEAQGGEVVDERACVSRAGRPSPDAAPQSGRRRGDPSRRPAARHPLSPVGRRAVSVGRRCLRRARARHRHDRDGIRRTRRRRVDQGQGRHGADRIGGELRGLRDAAIDRRSRAERRRRGARSHG